MAGERRDSVVLDASAVLALLLRERGGEAVTAEIGGAVLSAITVVEVATKLARLGMPPADARAVFEFHLPCPVIPFDAGQAFIAASLWPQAKAHNLSLGDRACLALAISISLPVLTADSKWSGVTVPVEVRQIRPRKDGAA